jgi:hypothetical protein
MRSLHFDLGPVQFKRRDKGLSRPRVALIKAIEVVLEITSKGRELLK